MPRHSIASTGRLLFGTALAAILLLATHTPAADFAATGPASVRIGMTRSDARKFLLRATAPGGPAWFSLDTGAPVSCADETKAALFKFQPLPSGPRSQLIMNGQPEKMAHIPQVDFSGLAVKNFPVALVNLSTLNQSRQRNGDRTGDAIFGLDALRSLHAVIDCGAARLFLHPNPAPANPPTGWRAIPLRLEGGHLLVPVTLNGFQTLFMLDTGAPASMIDSTLCSSQRIPVGGGGISMQAVNHQLQASLGTIADLRIGTIDLGQTGVAVFNLNALVGNPAAVSSMPFTGLIGAQTLERLKAIIDCDAMQLYIKQPGRGGWWIF